jgi:sterol desaturase/sphingolipid hydroxylase (fatty acid hydroxylase superfamily)
MHGEAWWYVFGLSFVVTALIETFWPFRLLPSSARRRWTSNAILQAASVVVTAAAFQLTGIALAVAIHATRHGLLNWIAIPFPVAFAVGFAALDLTNYTSHRFFHSVGLLWRVHKVHHSETDLDLTTGFRFHPLEGLLSQGCQLAVIALLGTPPSAVVLASMAIVVQDFFTHANLRLPETADRLLRWLVVTPAMHRIHHSERVEEQNGNFGTIFSFWDRLFGTYVPSLAADEARARWGLADVAEGSNLNAARLLVLPFRPVGAGSASDASRVTSNS